VQINVNDARELIKICKEEKIRIKQSMKKWTPVLEHTLNALKTGE
jgi:hypothetical protein